MKSVLLYPDEEQEAFPSLSAPRCCFKGTSLLCLAVNDHKVASVCCRHGWVRLMDILTMATHFKSLNVIYFFNMCKFTSRQYFVPLNLRKTVDVMHK